MKLIVDTNIAFSSILNSRGNIGKILFLSKGHFEFYSTFKLRHELVKHQEKLLKLTGYTKTELEDIIHITTQKITFIAEELIPLKHLLFAERLLEDIDPDDTSFVALTKHLKGKLWTGDKVLCNGLIAKKFMNVITTQELSDLFDKLEKQKQ